VGGGIDDVVTRVVANEVRLRDPESEKSEKPVSSALPYCLS
jgi:hypothetical protein